MVWTGYFNPFRGSGALSGARLGRHIVTISKATRAMDRQGTLSNYFNDLHVIHAPCAMVIIRPLCCLLAFHVVIVSKGLFLRWEMDRDSGRAKCLISMVLVVVNSLAL